ncbi:MAG: hypothetical protein GTN69_02445 [Armatimonadetes bacterium]|nr:hypothetical protein [Armatimonadota bacterium]
MLNTEIRPGHNAEWRRSEDGQVVSERVYVTEVVHQLGTDNETGAQVAKTIATCRLRTGVVKEIPGSELYPGGELVEWRFFMTGN